MPSAQKAEIRDRIEKKGSWLPFQKVETIMTERVLCFRATPNYDNPKKSQ